MLTCRQVVRILGSDEPLTLRKRIELRLHLMMCKHCSCFYRQLRMIKEAVSVLLGRKTSSLDPDIVREIEASVLVELKKKNQ